MWIFDIDKVFIWVLIREEYIPYIKYIKDKNNIEPCALLWLHSDGTHQYTDGSDYILDNMSNENGDK